MSKSIHGGCQTSIARNGFGPFSASASLPEAFAKVVRAFAHKPGVIAGDQSWTYQQLDRLSDICALRMARIGIERGHYVGIHMQRSVHAVIAMLAILKLGATYVPFDPAAPGQRLARQAANAGVRVVLVGKGEDAPEWFVGMTLSVGAQDDGEAIDLPPLQLHPLELAYVIYTSGSTNEAKGVCVHHRAVLDLVQGAGYCGFTQDDVVYHGMSIAFDGSTFEIWGSLLSGATLAIAPHGLSLSGICDLVEQRAVSVLLLSTGVFNAFGRDLLRRLSCVRVLLAGGDVMSPVTAAQFLEAGGQVLVNGYGPTEVTTFSHCHVMTSPAQAAGAIPIGVPINGTAAYVLDEAMQPVPLGQEGELYIASSGLAQGYLDNPVLSAERFLPDPFATDGSRMYRTGDLVRQVPGGRLDYLGRIDTQVKIRGFRVELGEIETCLHSLGAWVDACVIHIGDPQTSQLHAFCVPEHGALPAETILLEGLRRRLPDYMVPRRIHFVDALPLTINGKVDRRALAARVTTTDAGAEVKPSLHAADPLEQEVLGVLRRLLGDPHIEAGDHFFEAGGDSLAAMRFCAEIGASHAIDLPLAVLFDAESIAAVIESIRQRKQVSRGEVSAA
ncbi:MAG: non-ribosomal peptide synthetase [Dyella sp.]|uniref:non-ribosomal peptide synthetase n=1 Tax=Dyella sp. TaxID=1869338 RepID=UPI003F7D7E55